MIESCPQTHDAVRELTPKLYRCTGRRWCYATVVVHLRDLRDDEAAWAADQYRAIQFAPTPAGSVALVAELTDGTRAGLGRLVPVGGGAFELGGIWTDDAHRGHGIAAAMVHALIARAAGADLWCVPFVHLVDYYARFGFTPHVRPWPAAIAAKIDDCIARALPPATVLRRAP